MRKILLAGIFGLAAGASAASAQVTGVVTGGGVTTTFQGTTSQQYGQNYASQVMDGAGYPSYANYQVSNSLQTNNIVFANAATVEGSYAYLDATTSLAVTFTNGGATAVTPELQSTLTPGGFGFYVADSGANPDPVNPKDMNSPPTNINQTPSSTVPFTDFAPKSGQTSLGGATFSLIIAGGGTTIASYTGSVVLDYDPGPAPGPGNPYGGPAVVTPVVTLGGLASTLNNFALVTPADSTSTVGYQWGATDFEFAIPGGSLDPGDSRTVTYDTQVTAWTTANFQGSLCGGANQCPTFQAYSGFGDPIGMGGGGSKGLGPDQVGAGTSPFDGSGVDGLYFNAFQYGLPTFDSTTGMLTQTLSPDLLPALPLTPAAIPEPRSWVLMLAGIGLAGAALRRRARRFA